MATKFNKLDRVKVIGSDRMSKDTRFNKWVGKEATINSVDSGLLPYLLESDTGAVLWVKDTEIEALKPKDNADIFILAMVIAIGFFYSAMSLVCRLMADQN